MIMSLDYITLENSSFLSLYASQELVDCNFTTGDVTGKVKIVDFSC